MNNGLRKEKALRDMSRREFIKFAGAAAVGLAGYSLFGGHPNSVHAATSAPNGANVMPSAAEGLPLIDAHNHLPRGIELQDLISRMDRLGVDKTILMPVFYDGDKPGGQGISDENLVINWYKQQPSRIIPFFGMQRPILGYSPRWVNPPDNQTSLLLYSMNTALGANPYKGIGEFIIRHYSYSCPSGASGIDVDVPIDSLLMRKFLDMAAQYKLPITVHYEAEEKTIPPLKTMLEYRPEVTWIWAHCTGRCTPDMSRSMLKQYPNLYSDLGGMTAINGTYGSLIVYCQRDPKNPIEDGNNHLRQDWKDVFEEFPDRFVIGTDCAHPQAWQSNYFGQSLSRFKSLLSDLTDSTAKKIAYENITRILKL
jgi:hypothetical protein